MDTDCFVVKFGDVAEARAGSDKRPSNTSGDYELIAESFPKLFLEIKQHAILFCGNCYSFQVSAIDLFRLYENRHQFIGDPIDGDDDEALMVEEFLSDLVREIVVEISATDEEWTSFIQTGKPDLGPLYDKNGGFVYSHEEGYPVRLAYSHVAFKFGYDCAACNRLYGPL